MSTHPKSRRPRKPVYTASLRRLGTALSNPRLGLALRGTSLEEARNRKRNQPSTKERFDGNIYVYQPTLHRENNRTTLTKLHGSIVATVQYALKKNVHEWRKWRQPSDYPAVIILKNTNNKIINRYRDGSYQIGPFDRRRLIFESSEKLTTLETFDKSSHRHIPPKDVAAIVRLTKKEIQEAEARIKKKYGTSNGLMFPYECQRIMVNKVAQAVAKAYRKELAHPPKT